MEKQDWQFEIEIPRIPKALFGEMKTKTKLFLNEKNVEKNGQWNVVPMELRDVVFDEIDNNFCGIIGCDVDNDVGRIN